MQIFVDCLERRLLFADTRPYGIDTSHWDGTIDWNSVYGAGKVFAWQKATEGVTYNDPTLATNMSGAKNAGVLIGAYHFDHAETNSAATEAQHFIDTAKAYMTNGYLTPALDLESRGTLSTAALSQWVVDFETYMKRKVGVTPVIYVGRYAREGNLDQSVTIYPMWVAHWTYDPVNTSPNIGIWPSYAFWQYANNGTVPGVSTACDLDVFNGTMAQLQSIYAIPRTAVKTSGFIFDSGPTTKQTLQFNFNMNVSASLASPDLTLVNTTTGQTIPPANYTVTYDETLQRASFTFPSYTYGALPDGIYTATLSGNGISDIAGTTMASNYNQTFFVLAGDANRDRKVDLTDFTILASNFNQSSKTFSQGDFNYDGTVGLTDFTILASKFNQTLAADTATVQAAIAPATPTRVTSRLIDAAPAPQQLDELI
jgi:GH25 family lysozyme M1 (1,4-beta-N-acetylmuramidase)